MKLFFDNKATRDIAHNLVQHDRANHVEVGRFFIKEKYEGRIIEAPTIRTKCQLANILTKAVSSHKYSGFLHKLGMCDLYAPT